MVNILLESYNIDSSYLKDELKRYIKPFHKVAIVAFSFRDSQVKCLDEWNSLYSKEAGAYYSSIVNPLMSYGISEDSISFINYFADSKEIAKEKIEESNIVYFLGGLPDKMMDRIYEFDLYNTLLNYKGIVMGVSAGALIQLKEYHLSPDKDYPEFVYFNGIPYVDDFYLEVHYEGTKTQDDAIDRVINERQKAVYATLCFDGAMIVENGQARTLGKVNRYFAKGDNKK